MMKIKNYITGIFIIFILFIIPYPVLSDACNEGYLNSKVLTYYIGNETALPYQSAIGDIDWDLNGGNPPDRTIENWGYGMDFEHGNDDYLYRGTASTKFEWTYNITIGHHFIPESDIGDQQIVLTTLKLAGTYRGLEIQFRSDETFAHFDYYGNGNGNYYTKSSDSLNYGTHYYMVHEISTGKNKIFINNSESGYSNQQSGATEYWTGQHKFFLGASESVSREYDGILGNFVIFNGTLNSTCREYISLNEYPYLADTTPPDITLIYPINNTHYNNYNGSIIFNATDLSGINTCTLNNTDWIFDSIDVNTWRFDRIGTPDNNYSIIINCSDTKSNIRLQEFNFIVDTTYATINIYSPLNNSYHNSNVLFNVSYFDTYLYRTRTEITKNNSENWASSIQLVEGTLLNGSIESLKYPHDTDIYNISELGGIVLNINYTGIENFSEIGIYYRYEGNPAHVIYLSLWNYETNDYAHFIQLDEGVLEWKNFSNPALNTTPFINNGLVQIQINHTSPPNNLHYLEIYSVFLPSISDNQFYYLNDSGEPLFTNYYNITEYWDISDEPDGMYDILFEATDTHTDNIFNENPNYETGLTPSGQNSYVKYDMRYGEIEFITPLGIRLDTYQQVDRWVHNFYSLLETDLEEIEIEIIADKIEWFTDSTYPCHLILNEKYWYDCVGLNDAKIIEVSHNSAKFKFYHTIDNSFSYSLGGLNYINLSYTIYLDRVNPTLTNYTVTNSTTAIQWNLLFNENTTYLYTVGLNCSDNSIDTGTSKATNLGVTNLLLSSGTTHYMYIILTDDASNTNNYCINGTTSFSGVIDYGIIEDIVEQELLEGVTELNQAIMFLVIILLWAILFLIAYKTESKTMVIFTMIFGIFYSIWLYNNSEVPKLIVTTFATVNCYFIYYTWKIGKKK